MKPENVRIGDIMAFVYYAHVNNLNGHGNNLNVRDLDSQSDFNVLGKELVERSYSADRYEETKNVSKMEAAEILVNAYNRPFTVGFIKQDGSSRKLRGRLIKPEHLLGRSMCEDLEITQGNRLRQIDHRTIEYIILENVKYVVK